MANSKIVTIGMLNCVRTMRTLMIEIGRAAADKEQ